MTYELSNQFLFFFVVVKVVKVLWLCHTQSQGRRNRGSLVQTLGSYYGPIHSKHYNITVYISLDCRVVVNGCKYPSISLVVYSIFELLEKGKLALSVVTCKGQFRHWTYNNQNVGTQFHINWTLQLDPFSTNLANKNVPNKS
jgi:hypothetical protein